MNFLCARRNVPLGGEKKKLCFWAENFHDETFFFFFGDSGREPLKLKVEKSVWYGEKKGFFEAYFKLFRLKSFSNDFFAAFFGSKLYPSR